MSHAPQASDPTGDVRIVYVDRDVVVVEKPAGLATVLHPADRERLPPAARPATLERLLPGLIKRADPGRAPKGRPPPVRVVQRLDIGTSGLLVFARNRRAERELGNQFRRHTVTRSYLALVSGRLATSRRIESLLVADRGDGLRGSHPTRGRRAVTHVAPVEALDNVTLAACRLETGRTHQIRIHLAEAGHPLCGEPVYNRPPGAPPAPDESGAPRIMLHAGELGFRHPATGRPLHFTMAAPPDFQAFLEALRARRGAVASEAAAAAPLATGDAQTERPRRRPAAGRARPKPRRPQDGAGRAGKRKRKPGTRREP